MNILDLTVSRNSVASTIGGGRCQCIPVLRLSCNVFGGSALRSVIPNFSAQADLNECHSYCCTDKLDPKYRVHMFAWEGVNYSCVTKRQVR